MVTLNPMFDMSNLTSNCGPECSLPSATIRMCCLSEGKTEYLNPTMNYYEELLRGQEEEKQAKRLQIAMLEKLQAEEYKVPMKRQILVDEIIIPYLHNGNTDFRDMLINYDQEKEVERSLAKISKTIDHSATHHRDYTDGSDSKVGGVLLKRKKSGLTKNGAESFSFSFTWSTKNVVSKHGVAKDGPIRMTLVNVFDQSIQYYFIPKKDWFDTEMMTWTYPEGGKKSGARPNGAFLNGSWSKEGIYTFGKGKDLAQYQVGSFQELADKLA